MMNDHLYRGGCEGGGGSHMPEQRAVVQAQEWLQRQLLHEWLKRIRLQKGTTDACDPACKRATRTRVFQPLQSEIGAT